MNSNTLKASQYIKEARRKKITNAVCLGKDQMGGKGRVLESLVGKQNRIDVAPPYGKLTSDDFRKLRKGKKKEVKEGYSNWREELSEVSEYITKEQNRQKIVEKEVNNKIDINPTEKTGDRLSGMPANECVEKLGGTLLEMIEIDEIDYIIESVYDELIDEGYDQNDIEDAIEYALNEEKSKVTFGHDTPTTEKKREGLLSSARKNLSAIKANIGQSIASGARRVARGALGVARKMEGDKSKPHPAHLRRSTESRRPPSAAGHKEKVSSGSYKAPSRPMRPVEDPWEGSYSRAKPKPRAVERPHPAHTSPTRSPQRPPNAAGHREKVSSGSYTAPSRPIRPVENKPKGKTTTVSVSDVKAPKKTPKAPTTTTQSQKPTTPSKRRNKPKPKPKVEVIGKELDKPGSDLDNLLKSLNSESYQLTEKAESKQQQKLFGLALSVKRGETPRSKVSAEVLKVADTMTEKQLRDFAKTKHEGLPKKVQTKEEAMREELTVRMLAKIIEQAPQMPETQQKKSSSNIIQSKKRLIQQQLNSLNRGVDVDV